MAQVARLEGTWNYPRLRLSFHPWTPGPDGEGQTMLEWVKGLPGRFFDAETKSWVVDGLGVKDPEGELRRAGFDVDKGDFGEVDLREMIAPVAKVSKADPTTVFVRPRLAGYDAVKARLGLGATWDKKLRRFEIPATDLVDRKGKVKRGVLLSPEEAEHCASLHPGPMIDSRTADELSRIAKATSFVEVDELDDIPSWFGLNLFGYQYSGAIAAAAGLRTLADQPGLGKTRSALAAASISDPDRLLIVTPPVALTQWQREATASQVTAPDRYSNTEVVGASDKVVPGEHVVVMNPRRKIPAIPEQGVVVISDALLSSRPELAQQIFDWQPQVLIVDEVHRAKTWASARAKATRMAAAATTGPRYAISGTPMFAQPAELASPLAITGQLEPVFGSYGAFLEAFTRENNFGQLVPRMKELPRLHEILSNQVWVRRRKKDVLKDLPDKTRYAKIVDVDLSGFRATHKEVIETIEEWVEDQMGPDGSYPSPEEIEAYSKDSLRLVSKLRMAAGLAKIEPAVEIINEWLEEYPQDEDGLWERPLVVWTHHKIVTAAMAEAVEPFGGAEVIDGSTSQEDRTKIVDAFQAGKIPVLVASITAAGVGITLTRSQDAYFVETDWTPALVAQAEDRIHRISQTSAVSITTLIAPGTLDETVQLTLERKARILEVVMGDDDQNVAVGGDHGNPASAIVKDMVYEVIERMKRRRGKTRKPVARAA